MLCAAAVAVAAADASRDSSGSSNVSIYRSMLSATYVHSTNDHTHDLMIYDKTTGRQTHTHTHAYTHSQAKAKHENRAEKPRKRKLGRKYLHLDRERALKNTVYYSCRFILMDFGGRNERN